MNDITPEKKKYAWGLPEGSIRAILAVIMVAAPIIGWLIGREVPEFLIVASTAVGGFYFVKRTFLDK